MADKLSILFLRRRGEFAYASPLMFHEFEKAVGKIAGCMWAGEGWPLHKPGESVDMTVRRIYGGSHNHPDWVIVPESKVPVIDKRSYKVGHHISDIHGRLKLGINRDTPKLLKLINSMKYDAVFLKAPYIYGIKQHHGYFVRNLKPKWHFLPYSIDPHKFTPNRSKKWDATIIGSISQTYPLRQSVFAKLPDFCRQYGLTYLRCKVGPSPTWNAAQYENDPRYFIRERYATALAKSKILIFCGGIYSYPVQKYFEAAASGCLPLATKLRGVGRQLGFVNGVTYVVTSKRTWPAQLLYYHDNPDEAKKIADKSRRMVVSRHTHDIRAAQFVRMLETFGNDE